MKSNEILFRNEGGIGHITLNRPQALNALTQEMCASMLGALRAWADDSKVRLCAIDAVPGRAFCAGGDIRAICEMGKRRDGSAAAFFTTEYRLNAAIRHFPKPYIALIDGIAMGGGVGVSIHGSHRVVSEKVIFAMPETAIGLFPDVVGDIAPRLIQGDAPDALLAGLTSDPGPSALGKHRGSIDRAFAAPSVEAILEALANEGEWGRETAALLGTRSPTSLKLTFRQMHLAKTLDFDSCLRAEYRLMTQLLENHDLYEGVRAALIDKDQHPHWQPASLTAVKDDDVSRYFELRNVTELSL